jgi:hypothetical protein
MTSNGSNHSSLPKMGRAVSWSRTCHPQTCGFGQHRQHQFSLIHLHIGQPLVMACQRGPCGRLADGHHGIPVSWL